MVMAGVFHPYFLAALFASFCNAQIGYNPYAGQHPYNQQQPNNQQNHPQQPQQFYYPNQGFGSPQGGVQPISGTHNVIAVKPKTGVVNKPVRTTQDNSTSSAAVTVQLVSYTNTKLGLPDNGTCKCPAVNAKICGREMNRCQFSFHIILSAKDQSVSFISSEIYPIPDNGVLSTGEWSAVHNLTMTSKPQSIDVIVQYNGIGFHAQNSSIFYLSRMVVVDTFVALTANYIPVTGNSQPVAASQTLTGGLIQSSLGLRYSVKCNGNYKGKNCDLLCDPPVNSSTQVLCRHGQQAFMCTLDPVMQQVSSCQPCVNGVDKTTNTCRSAGYTDQTCNPGVSPAFRTWTIVLGCLLGIAVVFIILLIVFYVIVRNQNERQGTYRRTQPYQPPSHPLLPESKDDEWERSRPNPPAAIGRPSHTDPEISRSSDQSESVRNINGVRSPRREVAV
ncbi:hypothetical protein QR680_001807 [Steinernema hermaphroditum]|uniref:Uncharacterized protein n=1 Tax=Steinernema hermaphroditum TaxID=289476 RepID=A0AA39GZY3_9BILA|nr:hypothetical protein QR680_001807 [Steinernema hermaphroditum]